MCERLPEKCSECGQLIEHASDKPIVRGGLVLRPGFQTVEWNGQTVRLTKSEFDTLAFIAKREGPVRKLSVYTVVFEREDGTPEPKIVDVIVCKVRRRLAEIGAGGLIKTLWGVGYLLDETNGSPAVPTGQMRTEAANQGD